jgi:hypothetical protein
LVNCSSAADAVTASRRQSASGGRSNWMSRASHFHTRSVALTALGRVARRSIYPSAGACTTVSVPMLPRAPGGFSMMCRIMDYAIVQGADASFDRADVIVLNDLARLSGLAQRISN